MNEQMLLIEPIQKTLRQHQPRQLKGKATRHAAVAMLLFAGKSGPEVLFIRRADYDGDPWSGDVAFPGGGIDPQDESPRAAAERETWEEIGLKLQTTEYLGQLDDLAGAYLPVRISCFVYQLKERPPLTLNREVVDTFWVPLQTLLDQKRNIRASFMYRDETRSHPIIDLDGYCERFLWGITYRLLQSFFALFDLTIKSAEQR